MDEKEVVVEVPFRDGQSYTATIKSKQTEYKGEDKKTPGKPYILNEDGSKNFTDKNPTHIDWTVRVNDNMDSIDDAKVIDGLGSGLKIVEGTFVIEKFNRNYNNDEINRETVEGLEPTITESGFELNLGKIEDAYDITYTTEITRPGGGQYTINNNARIILDGDENDVSDDFTATWSEDLPSIDKVGKISEDKKDIIEWEVKYNYSKEDLGTVNLIDTLSHGEVVPGTIKVYQVEPDIDGNIISTPTEIDVIPVIEGSTFTIPDLDANGDRKSVV